MYNIFPQRVILGLDRLVVVLQRVQLSNLLLELLDIPFLSLSEGTLWDGRLRKLGVLLDDMRIDKARRPSRKSLTRISPTSRHNSWSGWQARAEINNRKQTERTCAARFCAARFDCDSSRFPPLRPSFRLSSPPLSAPVLIMPPGPPMAGSILWSWGLALLDACTSL
jgi:hypothetical protein